MKFLHLNIFCDNVVVCEDVNLVPGNEFAKMTQGPGNREVSADCQVVVIFSFIKKSASVRYDAIFDIIVMLPENSAYAVAGSICTKSEFLIKVWESKNWAAT